MDQQGAIVYDMSFDDYRRAPGINQSGLKLFQRSPEHYFAEYLDPQRPEKEDSDAYRKGKILHTAILESAQFDKRYVVSLDPKDYPKSIRTVEEIKAALDSAGVTYKKSEKRAALTTLLLESVPGADKQLWDAIEGEFRNKHAGKTEITKEELELSSAIGRKHRAHSASSVLMESGAAEVTLFWRDPEFDVPCKARLDWKFSDGILDIKTTEDASLYAFQRSIGNYGYDIQAAFYLDGLSTVLAVDVSSLSFIFEAIEKKRPYGIAFYYADSEMIAEGRRKYRALLQLYKECLRTNTWPGYSSEIMPISIPAWAKSKSQPMENYINEY